MSIWHLLILFFILLLIFGPQRLEGIGTSLGRAVRGFKEGLEGQDDLARREVIKDATKTAVINDGSTATTISATTVKKTTDV